MEDLERTNLQFPDNPIVIKTENDASSEGNGDASFVLPPPSSYETLRMKTTESCGRVFPQIKTVLPSYNDDHIPELKIKKEKDSLAHVKSEPEMFVTVGLDLTPHNDPNLLSAPMQVEEESLPDVDIVKVQKELADAFSEDESPTRSSLEEKLIKSSNEMPMQTFQRSIYLNSNGKTCDICGKTFPTRHRLSKHLISHSTDRPFFCTFCSKTFKRKEDLGKHLVAHSGQRAFKCDICDRLFIRKQDLSNHMSIHTENKPFECPECGKKFGQRGNLSAHMFFHNPDHALECMFCPKKFKRKDVLKRHLIVHTGERPYPCQHCEKRFTQQCNLNAHLLTHTGEKPWECSLCESRFSCNNTLKRHMRIHTQEKNFECHTCKKKFGYAQTLLRHKCKIDLVENGCV